MTQHRAFFRSSVVVAVMAGIAAVVLLPSAGSSPNSLSFAQSTNAAPHCSPIGGMLMTNFGAIDPSTTMGTATGELRGAVSASILGSPQPGAGNTVVFHVQHHWVTESGDTLNLDPADVTTMPISQTLFAVVTDHVHLAGGTGKFSGATGDIDFIGEVDLATGTVFRYSGQVCFAAPGND